MYRRKVPVVLNEDEIRQLDRLAKELGLSRASLIRMLCRIGIRQMPWWEGVPKESTPCSQPHS